MKQSIVRTAAIALCLAMGACSGSSSSSNGQTTAAPAVTGVATPHAVSVVTAN